MGLQEPEASLSMWAGTGGPGGPAGVWVGAWKTKGLERPPSAQASPWQGLGWLSGQGPRGSILGLQEGGGA